MHSVIMQASRSALRNAAARTYYTMPRGQASSAESVTLGPNDNQALGIGTSWRTPAKQQSSRRGTPLPSL